MSIPGGHLSVAVPTQRGLISQQILASSSYVRSPNGKGYVPAKLAGVEALQEAHDNIEKAPSQNKLNARSSERAKHLVALRALKALDANAQTPEHLEAVARLAGQQVKKLAKQNVHDSLNPELQESLHTLSESLNQAPMDNNGKPSPNRFKKAFYSFDNYTSNRKLFSSKEGMVSEELNTTKQRVARRLILIGKRLSSIGDMVNAVTTTVIGAFCYMCHPPKDQNSLAFKLTRFILCWPALFLMGGSSLAIRALINLIPGGSGTTVVGRALDAFVGWYWWLAPFHFLGGATQLAGASMRNVNADLSKAQLIQVAKDSERAFENLFELVKSCTSTQQEAQDWKAPVLKSLRKSVDKDTAEKVFKTLFEQRKGENLTLADLKGRVLELLGNEDEGQVFKNEKALLSLMWTATDQAAACNLEKNQSMKTSSEKKFGSVHTQINRTLAGIFYSLSKGRETGGYGYMYKAADFFYKQASETYRKRDDQRLNASNSIKRFDPKYKHHISVLADKDNKHNSWLTRSLARLGDGWYKFGMVYALSIDTNVARGLRRLMMKIYEKCTHEHASMMGSQTAGMLVGWFTVGLALNLMNLIYSGGLSAIPMVGDTLSRLGIGLFSLTLWCAMVIGPATAFMAGAKAIAHLDDVIDWIKN